MIMSIIEVINSIGTDIKSLDSYALLIFLFIFIFLVMAILIMISQEKQKQKHKKPLVREDSWVKGKK